MKIHQEEDRIPEKTILAVMAGVLVISAVGIVVAWLLMEGEVEREEVAPAPPRVMEPPVRGPEVARDIEAARRDLYRQPPVAEELAEPKRRRLHNFGWVDEQRDVVHIPIERAMQLYLRRHRDRAVPAEPAELGAATPAAPQLTMPQEKP